MDQDKNQSAAPVPSRAKGRLIDFGPSKHPQNHRAPNTEHETRAKESEPQNSGATTDHPPVPVTSAQAAINARYANQPRPVATPLVSSAREAVNAASSAASNSKPAANLHHGKIQRNMESTRTSASALIKRAEDDRKSPTSASVSGDPLSHFGQPAPAHSVRQDSGVPIVRTSLKLGAAARPKQAPMVLPANAKMAQAARPVGKDLSMIPRKSAARLTPREAIDAQVIQPDVLAAPRPAARKLVSGAAAQQNVNVNTHANTAQTSKTARQLQTRPAQAANPAGQRFRTKPKDFSANQPAAMPADSSYVMTEPPKIKAQRHENPAPKPEAELGVVEDYYTENAAKVAGDKAPLGRAKEQTVASGHGGAASKPTFTIKSENTSNYSFSQPKDAPDNNRYTLGGQSPFIKSVNVEKRPLSDNISPNAPLRPASYERAVLVQSDAIMPGDANNKLSKKDRKAAAKAEKAARKHKDSKPEPAVPARREVAKSEERVGRKNRYDKKTVKKNRINPRPEMPTRPTVIVPSSRRSKAPLFFLIMVTILLGAAVGGAVYLCFFQ